MIIHNYAPPQAIYAMWWPIDVPDDWCVVAHEEDGHVGHIPAISVQFDMWKPRERSKPKPTPPNLNHIEPSEFGLHLKTKSGELEPA